MAQCQGLAGTVELVDVNFFAGGDGRRAAVLTTKGRDHAKETAREVLWESA